MRVEWHGQSAFTLTGEEATVFIDPFGDMSSVAERGLRFEYPPIEANGDAPDGGRSPWSLPRPSSHKNPEPNGLRRYGPPCRV